MKTTPMQHQIVGVDLLGQNLSHYMLACEQGTGKTWMLIADAENQFVMKTANALLVIAPKGVHTNWIRREIPAHMSLPHRAAYFSSGASRKIKNEIERLFRCEEGEIAILAINIDAINHAQGFALAKRFLEHFRAIMDIDESSRIKNPAAGRSKKAWDLGEFAVSRRIASGTPVTNSPIDLFSQFEFLGKGRGLLGTRSYRAFVAEYAELLPADHKLMMHIATKAKYPPQIVATDENGQKKWRNLEKLSRKLAPYMYRVLKKDCLDLPDKIFKTVYYELEPKQRALYDFVREELRLEIDEDIDIYSPLTVQTKLQQIAAGFLMRGNVSTVLGGPFEEDDTNAPLIEFADNPRIELLRNTIEDIDGQFIVWARFKQEIRQIAELMRELKIPAVEYHGSVKPKDRELAVDEFQASNARAFIGNAQSGGIGLTLTKATTVIYYSQSYNLEDRLQSEDRAHRIGTNTNVVYIDLCAVDTIDEKISAALQNKQRTASIILDGKPGEEAAPVAKKSTHKKRPPRTLFEPEPASGPAVVARLGEQFEKLMFNKGK